MLRVHDVCVRAGAYHPVRILIHKRVVEVVHGYGTVLVKLPAHRTEVKVKHVDHLVHERACSDIEIRTAWVPDDDELIPDAAAAARRERGQRMLHSSVSPRTGRDQLCLKREPRYVAPKFVLEQTIVYGIEQKMHIIVVYIKWLVCVPQRVLKR